MDLLFKLLTEINIGSDTIILFADEGGSCYDKETFYKAARKAVNLSQRRALES
jgi:hypothetical protein